MERGLMVCERASSNGAGHGAWICACRYRSQERGTAWYSHVRLSSFILPNGTDVHARWLYALFSRRKRMETPCGGWASHMKRSWCLRASKNIVLSNPFSSHTSFTSRSPSFESSFVSFLLCGSSPDSEQRMTDYAHCAASSTPDSGRRMHAWERHTPQILQHMSVHGGGPARRKDDCLPLYWHVSWPKLTATHSLSVLSSTS